VAGQGNDINNVSSHSANAESPLPPESIEELREVARRAMRRFHKTPDYSIDSTPQPPEHEQVEIALGHRRASVDKGIAVPLATFATRNIRVAKS
jgi:hypothetical protein